MLADAPIQASNSLFILKNIMNPHFFSVSMITQQNLWWKTCSEVIFAIFDSKNESRKKLKFKNEGQLCTMRVMCKYYYWHKGLIIHTTQIWNILVGPHTISNLKKGEFFGGAILMAFTVCMLILNSFVRCGSVSR